MNHSIEQIDGNRTRRVLRCNSVETDRDVWSKSVFADWPGIVPTPGYTNVVYWRDPMVICAEPMTVLEFSAHMATRMTPGDLEKLASALMAAATSARDGKAKPGPTAEQTAEDARRIELEAMAPADLRTLYTERGLGSTKGLSAPQMAGKIMRKEREAQPLPAVA
jgi:hypothetical protein